MELIQKIKELVLKKGTKHTRMDRKGFTFLANILATFATGWGVVLLVVGILAIGLFSGKISWPGSGPTGLAIDPADVMDLDLPTETTFSATDCGLLTQSCDDTSIIADYNDIDALSPSTDPGGSIYSVEDYTTTADDGDYTTGVGLIRTFIVGDGATGYFNYQLEPMCMPCSRLALNPKVYKATAPTIYVLNEDGKSNTDSDHGDLSASSDYTWTVRVKSASNACAMNPMLKEGAVFAIEYDKTYTSQFDSNMPSNTKYLFSYLDHGLINTTTADGWASFLISGDDLCDSELLDFSIVQKTTSGTPAEDLANWHYHWLPLQGFRNTETDAFEYGVQKDDGVTSVTLGNTTAEVFTV